MNSPIPIVRLEVEGMKHSILAHLASAGEEMQTAVEAEVERFLSNFDFAVQARVAIYEVVPRLIEDAIKQAMEQALWNHEVRKKLNNLVTASLVEALVERDSK